MTDIAENLFSRMTTHGGLNALISTRCYPIKSPKKPTAPFLVYQGISTTRESAMGSDLPNIAARYQVDIYAQTFASALAVKAQLLDALQRWTNASDLEVEDVFIQDVAEGFERESELYRIRIDAMVHYKEA